MTYSDFYLSGPLKEYGCQSRVDRTEAGTVSFTKTQVRFTPPDPTGFSDLGLLGFRSETSQTW